MTGQKTTPENSRPVSKGLQEARDMSRNMEELKAELVEQRPAVDDIVSRVRAVHKKNHFAELLVIAMTGAES